MKFEWDMDKNRANKQKYKVSFELACTVFEDPFHRTEFDREIDGEEYIRIISARKANAEERSYYEEGI